MKPQIFLIVPAMGEINKLYQRIDKAFSFAKISALLLLRNNVDEENYKKLVQKLLVLTHANDCALLIDDNAELAKAIGADGVHISKDINSLKNAIKLLKPDMIVGAGNINSKHDAMIKGELDVDYVFFGDIGTTEDEYSKELAGWWAKNVKVPAVYYTPNPFSESSNILNIEFIAILLDIFLSEPANE